jgi:hypothetical protein
MAIKANEDVAAPVQPSEEERVAAWKMEMFWNIGFTLAQCENLTRCACDWHDAKKLLDQGCLHRWVYLYLMP